MNKTLLYIIRHGRTAGNEKDIYRGWSNEEWAQLSPEGRKDVTEAAVFLKRFGLKFPIILTDDLARSVESASIVAKILGIPEAEVDKRLRPLNVGDYTGKSKKKYPLDEYAKNRSKKIPGGENMDGFDNRLARMTSDMLELVAQLGQPILFIGHGSTIAFLYNAINGGKAAGYEGLVEPGGVLLFSLDGLFPVLKEKTDDKSSNKKNQKLVQLEKWSIEFVGGKPTNDEPKACTNCHMLYATQKRCSILGPDIVIDAVKKDGKKYSPVCGEHDAGKPMCVRDSEVSYPAALLGEEKADEVGLEWAEGEGTNCGGMNDGAACKYFDSKDGKDGICQVLQENGSSDSAVDSDDCCAAHDGPAIEWREAQKLLKD